MAESASRLAVARWPAAGQYDEPITPPSPWQNMAVSEVQHLRPEAGLPPDSPAAPGLTPPEARLYSALLDCVGRINSAAINGAIPEGVRVPVLGELAEGWSQSLVPSCVEPVAWRLREPHPAPTATPAETFAVIRYTGDSTPHPVPKLFAHGVVQEHNLSGICAPLGEADWDRIAKDAVGWEPVCRSIPSFEMAQSIAWTLSSRPFSE